MERKYLREFGDSRGRALRHHRREVRTKARARTIVVPLNTIAAQGFTLLNRNIEGVLSEFRLLQKGFGAFDDAHRREDQGLKYPALERETRADSLNVEHFVARLKHLRFLDRGAITLERIDQEAQDLQPAFEKRVGRTVDPSYLSISPAEVRRILAKARLMTAEAATSDATTNVPQTLETWPDFLDNSARPSSTVLGL
jgi:hypothetical protein